MRPEEQVHQASEKFYAALNRMLNGDANPLVNVWSHDDGVTAMNLIGGRQSNWSDVRQTFENFSKISTKGQVKLNEQVINVVGDMAYELGVERGQTTIGGQSYTIDHRVTNIYRHEGDTWKVVHHHTDVSPWMVDILQRTPIQPK
jgi:ketosteroid isomerase-like protein